MTVGRAAVFCGAVACLLVAQAVAFGQTPPAKTAGNKGAPTTEEAKIYIENAEKELFDLGVKASRAAWVQENFITEDTEQIAADA